MKAPFRIAATCLTLFTFASPTWAVDCARWADHSPGQCGVVSNDAVCANAANRTPGRCQIPSSSWYVDNNKNLINNNAQSVMAAAGTFDLRNPDGTALALVASGAGNLVAQGAGNLIAQGAGNLAGNMYGLKSVGNKKIYVFKR